MMTDGAQVDGAAVFHDWRRTYARRLRWLLALLGLWTLVLSWRLLDVMVWERREHVERFERQALRIGTLPALRGRILDQNGLPLAWSERSFQLVYRAPTDPALIAGDLAYIDRVLPRQDGRPTVDVAALRAQALSYPGRDLVALDGLPPDLGGALVGLVRHERWLLASRFRRCYGTADPALLAAIGRTRQHGHKEVGISGWEREQDLALRGTDARYVVLVDRWGNWLPGTWRQLRDPQPGRDWAAPVQSQAR